MKRRSFLTAICAALAAPLALVRKKPAPIVICSEYTEAEVIAARVSANDQLSSRKWDDEPGRVQGLPYGVTFVAWDMGEQCRIIRERSVANALL